MQELLAAFLVDLFQLFEDGFRFLRSAHGTVGHGQPVVRVGLVGIQANGFFQRRNGFFVLLLLCVDTAQIQMRNAQVRLQFHGFLQQGQRFIEPIPANEDVAKIGLGLCVSRVVGELPAKGQLGIFKFELLPVEISQAKMDVGLARSDFGSGLKFTDGLGRPVQPIQRLSHQHMGSRRVRRVALHLLKDLQDLGKLVAPEIAFRQNIRQRGILGLGTRYLLELYSRLAILSRTVVAHAEQRSGLHIAGLQCDGLSQRPRSQ